MGGVILIKAHLLNNYLKNFNLLQYQLIYHFGVCLAFCLGHYLPYQKPYGIYFSAF